MAKAYERIADDLRDRIRAGQLGPGDRLPAETTLAGQYGKSLPTLRRALGLLQAEGLVEKVQGRGNVVRRPRTPLRRSNLRHQWEKDRVHAPQGQRARAGATEYDTGLVVADLVFQAAYREVEADDTLAATFGVPPGTALLEREYRTRHRLETDPFALVRSYVLRDMVAANPDLLEAANEPWPGGTHHQLFTVGIETDRIDERVTARPPTAEEAGELGLPLGTAVIVLRRTTYGVGGRVVEFSEVRLPGDRTEMLFTTYLERW